VFDTTGARIAVVGSERVRVWDLSTGQETAAPESPFWVDPDPRAESPVIANLLASKHAADACAQRGRVTTLASADGRFVAIDHGKQMVSLWTAAGAQLVSFSTVGPVTTMAFNDRGTLLATGDARGAVMLCQTDGMSLGQFKHDEPISHLAFSPDGSFLAVASLDSMLRIWIASRTVLATMVGQRVSGPLTDEEWARYLGDEPRGE